METIPKQGDSNARLNNPNKVNPGPVSPQKKEIVKGSVPSKKLVSIRDELKEIKDMVSYDKKREDTEKNQKPWKFPFKWRRIMNQSLKKQARDKVLFIYLNKKNEIEQPKLLPIYSGNMVIYKNSPYEMDPRAVLTMRSGRKFFKVMIYKEIDRRPVSNLDYTEIKRRGDATDSDEFLIKAALRAQQHKLTKQQVSRGVIVFVILAVVGGTIWFMTR